MLYSEMKMVSAALMWLSSPPSMTVRTCHMMTSELKKTNAPAMASPKTGICRNRLATTAIIRMTPPTERKRPRALVSTLAFRAITDMTPNTAAVIRAAVATRFAPPGMLRLYCSSGEISAPMPKVKTIKRPAPTLL